MNREYCLKNTNPISNTNTNSDHEETQYNSRGQKKKKVMSGKLSSREEMALESQKAELKTLLSQPLISRGVSGKYLTMNDSQLAHQLAHDNR